MRIFTNKRNSNKFFLNPFFDIINIKNKVNQLFNTSITRYNNESSNLFNSPWFPVVDIVELENHVLVKADLPGMKEDEIDVVISDNTLIIKGEKKQDKRIKGKKKQGYIKLERVYGKFIRSFPLPVDVEVSNPLSTCRDGVFSLILDKKKKLEN